MKKLTYVLWAVVLVAVVALLLRLSDGNWVGSILCGAFVVGMVASGVHFGCKMRAEKKELRYRPVPKSFDEFDSLVWDLDFRDWYLEKICKKEDLESMVEPYRNKVRAIWNADYEDPEEQVDEAELYARRLETLLWCIKQK